MTSTLIIGSVMSTQLLATTKRRWRPTNAAQQVAPNAPAAFLKYGIELSRRGRYTPTRERAASTRVTQLDPDVLSKAICGSAKCLKRWATKTARASNTNKPSIQRAKPNDAWAKDAAQRLKDMK